MDDKKLANWASIVTAVVALIALVITSLVSYRTIKLTEQTVDLQASIAIDYQGSEFCRDYRAEVAALISKGVPDQAIKDVLSKESARDPDYKNAYDVYARECASVEDVRRLVPKTK